MTSFRVIVRAARQFDADGAAQMGAALSYYALFSTAPLLVLAVMVAGLVFGEAAAMEQVRDHLTEMIGPEGAREVASWMTRVMQPSGGTLAGLLGGGALILGALGAFLHLRRCLHVIWRLEPPTKSGLLATLLGYLLAVVMVLSVGVLLLISLAASTALPLVDRYLEHTLPGGAALWQWLEAGFSFAFLTLSFAVLFHVLSGRRISWGYLWYGSIITALLFTAGKIAVGYYLAYTGTASAYGAAGSLVVFLVWVYYSSQITFFGAELVQARRTRDQWLHGG